MNLRKIIFLFIISLITIPATKANDNPDEVIDIMNEKVIVGKDTVNLVIPERNFGRYDRGLYNYLFIPKKQWAFGLTASYGEFNADDVQILDILEDFDFGGKIYSINPSASYFFKNNQSVGLRFNYTRADADINSLSIDFDEDLDFSIKNVTYYSRNYSASIFYRNYIGLNKTEKRFAIFNEVALTVGGGSSRFKRYYNDELRNTHTKITEASLNFSPGVCMFIMDNVSFNVSFGVFGVKLRNEKQTTNGVNEGSRFSSGANFKFNLFNINFGLGVHI